MEYIIDPNYEYLIVIAIIGFLIFSSLRKQEGRLSIQKASSLFDYLCINKEMSNCIKALACLFVLMGHYGKYNNFEISDPWSVSKVMWLFSANIALVWFMFFSGYGLSLKDYSNQNLTKAWWSRVKKIYMPLFLTCTLAMILYIFLPSAEKANIGDAFIQFVPEPIYQFKNFGIAYLPSLSMALFGLFDWYVFCILIFYTIFYVSVFLSKHMVISQTIILAFLMVLYFLVALFVIGREHAQYYRYPWAFVLGHIVASYRKNSMTVNYGVVLLFILLLIMTKELMPFAGGFLAVLALMFFSAISRKYIVTSRLIIFIGSISYFFYLSHERIGFTLMLYTGFDSILFWILISICVSYVLKVGYDKIKIS